MQCSPKSNITFLAFPPLLTILISNDSIVNIIENDYQLCFAGLLKGYVMNIIRGVTHMNSEENLSDHLASFMYRLDDIKHIHSSQLTFQQQDRSLYTMLLFRQAKGTIYIQERSHAMEGQIGFILSPGTEVKLSIDDNLTVDYYQIRFHALQYAGNDCFTSGKVRFPEKVFLFNNQVLNEMVENIGRNFQSKDSFGGMEANIRFQEMILFLFKDYMDKQKVDLKKAITLTKDYMEQKYSTNITRKRLAEIAGVSTDYYSRMFKRETGKSPMEYLTDIRIKKAEQLLIHSDEKLSTVANKVGFNDEFYFSRKFKAMKGCSPTIYIKKIKSSPRITSLKHLLTGHLLTLGIEPYAAVISNAYPVITQLRNTIPLGEFDPDLEKLMEVKPDLILTRDYHKDDKSLKEKMVEQIAPTVNVPFLHEWRMLFQTIAKIIEKEKEASIWLEYYDQKVEKVRKLIERKIEDEKILVIGIGKEKICVYGTRNVGTVLYGDLRLKIPKGVEEIEYFKEITLEDLFGFEADRILLTPYKHDGTVNMDQMIQNKINALFTSEKWQELKAVRNRAIYGMYDHKHLYTCYTSYTHNLLLDKLQRLFVTESSI